MTQDIAAPLGAGVIRKATWRLIPFMALLYFINYLDRVNVSFAALTMNEDLAFSATVYGNGAGILFVGYVLFMVPSNIILDKVGARRWVAVIMAAWGLISLAMAFVDGPVSFYVLRFFLGAPEAGFFPGMILYLAFWFPVTVRARITGLFLLSAPCPVFWAHRRRRHRRPRARWLAVAVHHPGVARGGTQPCCFTGADEQARRRGVAFTR